MRAALRSLPIRVKVVLATTLASLVALLVTFAGILVYEIGSFRPQAVESIRASADLLAPVLAPALRFRDPSAAAEDLRFLRADESICEAVVFDPDGRRFAALDVPRHPETVTGPVSEGVHFDGRHVRLAVPITEAGDVLGSLVLVRDLPPLVRRLPQYGLMLAAVAFALLSASMLLTLGMRRTLTEPVLNLVEAAESIRDGRSFDLRVPRTSGDEIGRLTDAFNGMLDTIQRREQELEEAHVGQQRLREELEEAARLESVGRLAGGVAHDFNNLLTIIGGSADLALRQAGDPEAVRRLLGNVRRATTQASDLTGRLLAFARREPLELRPVDLRALVLDSRGMIRSILGSNVELALNPGDSPCWAETDPNQLTQVLINLVLNARDAMPAGGRLEISLEGRDDVPQDLSAPPARDAGPRAWVLRVADDGHGMSDETRRRVFEPFFTTKEAGRGTGLGLASSYGIVRNSGGSIDVTSHLGQGSTFSIWLPRADPSSAVGRASGSGSSIGVDAVEATILLAEDDALVRSTVVETLSLSGYRVIEAAGGAEGLELAARHADEIEILVTDIVMPGMSGLELAYRLRDENSKLRVLFVSGHSTEELPSEAERWASFLPKPFDRRQLLEAVAELLRRPVAGRRP